MSDNRCCYCHREIMKMRDGAWYHKRNGSVSCNPGWTKNKATLAGVR